MAKACAYVLVTFCLQVLLMHPAEVICAVLYAHSLNLCAHLGFYPIGQQICMGSSLLVRVLSLLLREYVRLLILQSQSGSLGHRNHNTTPGSEPFNFSSLLRSERKDTKASYNRIRVRASDCIIACCCRLMRPRPRSE